MSPVMRRGYYRHKQATRGYRHFVSSAIEYTVGSSLQSSSRKIPFYSLLIATSKPNHRNKKQPPEDTMVLCDTGASISLAPVSITQQIWMKIEMSEVVTIRSADGQKIKVTKNFQFCAVISRIWTSSQNSSLSIQGKKYRPTLHLYLKIMV